MAYHKSSPLPSVTQVLAPFVDYSRIPANVLEAASERGSRVHGICAARIQGLWHPSVSEDVAGYVKSFDDWAIFVDSVTLAEGELVDEAHGFAGHPDLILRLRGDEGLTLVDLKTPAVCMPAWRIQLSAYQHLAEANGYKISRVFSLRLKKNGGRASVDEYSGTARKDFGVFLSALNCHRYFKGGK